MQLGTRGLLDHLTYTVDVARAVPDKSALRVARAIVGGQSYRQRPETYATAIEDALRDPGPIARAGEDEQHLRAFLADVLAQLDASRPWQEPAYRGLALDDVGDLLQAPAILRLTEPYLDVMTVLHERFESVGDEQVALVLQLRNGPKIALTASTRPGQNPVEIRARGVDPAALRDLLQRATGLDVQPV